MGELIDLAERRADRSRSQAAAPPAFFFDLACPFSYLAAERVERLLGEVEWVPAGGIGSDSIGDVDELCARAERRAAELRLPLVWPDRFPSITQGALRAATRATHSGSGSRFALAALRLAFCGGFDLEDPEVLAEAAAAAGVTLRDCLEAAADPQLDTELEATTRGLATKGVCRLPAVGVGRRFYDGEERLSEIAALLRSPGAPEVATPRASPVRARAVRAEARAPALSARPLAPAG
jgi:2-hydroxychromene-2-carboxylate isomerase